MLVESCINQLLHGETPVLRYFATYLVGTAHMGLLRTMLEWRAAHMAGVNSLQSLYSAQRPAVHYQHQLQFQTDIKQGANARQPYHYLQTAMRFALLHTVEIEAAGCELKLLAVRRVAVSCGV